MKALLTRFCIADVLLVVVVVVVVVVNGLAGVV